MKCPDGIHIAACRNGAERASLYQEVARTELGIYVATLVGGWSEILRTDEKSLVDNYACAHFHLISNEAERRSGLLSKSTYLRAVEKLQRLALTIDEEIDEISLLIRARKLKIEIANYVNGYDGVD